MVRHINKLREKGGLLSVAMRLIHLLRAYVEELRNS
jgi:hypothetical protein